jgi:protein TonB
MPNDIPIPDTHARDLRFGGAVSLALHAALLLVGLAVTTSRTRFTTPAVQTIRLEVDLPVTPPAAEILVTPAAPSADVPVPQPSAAPSADVPLPQPSATPLADVPLPQPIAIPPVDAPVPQAVTALPAATEERRPLASAPREVAPAAPAAVAADLALADRVTTLVATDAIAKRLSGTGTNTPRDHVPPPPMAAPAAGSHRTGTPQTSAIALRRELQPPYPLGARQRGEEGTVALETTVTTEGKPTLVSVITSSGFADLDRAARKALQRAGFHPATENGRPVEARAHITIVFRLTN